MKEKIKRCPKCGRDLSLRIAGLSSSPMTFFICPYCTRLSGDVGADPKIQDFKIFVRCLSVAYKEFCLNRKMRKEIEAELHHKFEQQWNTILVALELDYMLWLAKILEIRPACLKNYRFTGDHKTTEKKLDNWRDDFLAHFNSNTLKNWENFRKENDLEPNSIKSLFDKIIEIADQYNKSCNLLPNLRESFQQIQEETLNECDKWLDNFKPPSFWGRFLGKKR